LHAWSAGGGSSSGLNPNAPRPCVTTLRTHTMAKSTGHLRLMNSMRASRSHQLDRIGRPLLTLVTLLSESKEHQSMTGSRCPRFRALKLRGRIILRGRSPSLGIISFSTALVCIAASLCLLLGGFFYDVMLSRSSHQDLTPETLARDAHHADIVSTIFWLGVGVLLPPALEHEPVFGTPLVWCPAFRRSGPAEAGTPNGRFMGRTECVRIVRVRSMLIAVLENARLCRKSLTGRGRRYLGDRGGPRRALLRS
jgi:hypothetical protein